jgi:hypothetical protein
MFECAGAMFDFAGATFGCAGIMFDRAEAIFDCAGATFACAGVMFERAEAIFDCAGATFDRAEVLLEHARVLFSTQESYLQCKSNVIRIKVKKRTGRICGRWKRSMWPRIGLSPKPVPKTSTNMAKMEHLGENDYFYFLFLKNCKIHCIILKYKAIKKHEFCTVIVKRQEKGEEISHAYIRTETKRYFADHVCKVRNTPSSIIGAKP